MFALPPVGTSCSAPAWGASSSPRVDAALNRVAENPLQYQVLHREARRAIVHRFPYGVFHRIEASNIIVFCVSHLHRDPATWKSRGGVAGLTSALSRPA
jgi:plasmid stabilization system protein ParE